ncbi:hypothetical protein KCP78_02440 [Salmonella enterica subsp. enterica]|nr:hypothetical protein KCP78_02440 [Salmonella enterica subsp. enterica]
MESQLKQQNAADRLDEVLGGNPRVREDLGFIPLVTPPHRLSAPGGAQRLTGERYKTIAKRAAGILKGEIRPHAGADERAAFHPGPRCWKGLPGDLLRPTANLLKAGLAERKTSGAGSAGRASLSGGKRHRRRCSPWRCSRKSASKFLENRHNPAAFVRCRRREAPFSRWQKRKKPAASGVYTVEVEGKAFVVVSDGGDISQLTAAVRRPLPHRFRLLSGERRHPVTAPLAGQHHRKVIATEGGQTWPKGDNAAC